MLIWMRFKFGQLVVSCVRVWETDTINGNKFHCPAEFIMIKTLTYVMLMDIILVLDHVEFFFSTFHGYSSVTQWCALRFKHFQCYQFDAINIDFSSYSTGSWQQDRLMAAKSNVYLIRSKNIKFMKFSRFICNKYDK